MNFCKYYFLSYSSCWLTGLFLAVGRLLHFLDRDFVQIIAEQVPYKVTLNGYVIIVR